MNIESINIYCLLRFYIIEHLDYQCACFIDLQCILFLPHVHNIERDSCYFFA